MDYENLVGIEYNRYVENFGSLSFSNAIAPINNAISILNEQNETLLNGMVNLSSAIQNVNESVNRKRVKIPIRDSNGLITQVIEE